MTIEALIEGIIRREGGYVNHPSDKGGPTNWGITEAVARENGYTGDMRDMPRDIARVIYLKQYYIRPGFDRINEISPRIAEEMTDTGVNMGVAWSGIFLQRSLNAFNLRERLYPDLKVDGACGERTGAALMAFLAYRKTEGEGVMLSALNCLQGCRYIELTESRPKNEDFIYGWIKERVG